MRIGTFGYHVVYQMGKPGEISGLIATLVKVGKPLRAMLWSVPKRKWIYAPALAATLLYDDLEGRDGSGGSGGGRAGGGRRPHSGLAGLRNRYGTDDPVALQAEIKHHIRVAEEVLGQSRNALDSDGNPTPRELGDAGPHSGGATTARSRGRLRTVADPTCGTRCWDISWAAPTMTCLTKREPDPLWTAC